MEREEVRAAAPTPSPRTGDGDWGSTRLPMLSARPGNVGVQIDSYRAMKSMFHRPRCGQFTAHFLGYTFENSSMDNYQRVVERTAQRAQALEAKLTKLREHEQRLVDDEAQRKARRREREAARQRRRWQHLQGMKRQDQRERETSAALAIQRRVRGMAARWLVAAAKRQRAEHRSHAVLQRTLTTYALRCRRHRQIDRAKRESAATVLQRRARSFVIERRVDRASGTSASSPPVATMPDEEVLAALADVVAIIALTGDHPSTDTPPIEPTASLLGRDISLDLLFSDDEGGEDSPAVASPLLAPFAPRPPPPATGRAKTKRPVARVKRVGGGFRPSAGTASPPPPVRRRS